jgi:hypothetical protein
MRSMKGNLTKMKFWTCNFILMHYWIEVIVLCYLKGSEIQQITCCKIFLILKFDINLYFMF